MQELGIASIYKSNDATQVYKANHGPSFPAAQTHLTNVHQTQRFGNISTSQNLMEYVKATWLDSTIWSPDRWSVFHCSVRTSNDVEGWHRCSNHHAGCSKLLMYLPLNLLHQESTIVPPSASFVRQESEATAMP